MSKQGTIFFELSHLLSDLFRRYQRDLLIQWELLRLRMVVKVLCWQSWLVLVMWLLRIDEYSELRV